MAMLPSYASAQNPVDATAQAIGEVGYAPLRRDRAQSERIDTILLISSLANESRAKKMADELAAITGVDREADPDVHLHDRERRRRSRTFAEAGIPCYTSMPSCARAIRALVDYGALPASGWRSAPASATAPASARRGGAARSPLPARC